MWCVMWCAWDVTRDTCCLSIFTPALANNNHHFFRAMADAESDVSCIPATQPSAPHQLPQPSVRSCKPSDDDDLQLYFDELIEMLLEVLDESVVPESHGNRTVTWQQRDQAGHTTSVRIDIHRGVPPAPMLTASSNW